MRSGLIFEPTSERGRAVALARASGEPLPTQMFPASDLFYDQDCMAGTPDWLPAGCYPVAFGEDSVWSVHLATGQAVLSCHDKTGRLMRTLEITVALLAGAERTEATRLCLAALGGGVAVALGNRLVLVCGESEPAFVELPGQAAGLITTLPHTRAGVVVLLEQGAVLHWIGAEGNLIELSRDLAVPQAAFVPGGPLVLVSGDEMLLLDVDLRGVQKSTRVEWTGQHPVGVCQTANPGEFAVLGAAGEMTVFQIPQ
jgi:hypothetical protein